MVLSTDQQAPSHDAPVSPNGEPHGDVGAGINAVAPATAGALAVDGVPGRSSDVSVDVNVYDAPVDGVMGSVNATAVLEGFGGGRQAVTIAHARLHTDAPPTVSLRVPPCARMEEMPVIMDALSRFHEAVSVLDMARIH